MFAFLVTTFAVVAWIVFLLHDKGGERTDDSKPPAAVRRPPREHRTTAERPSIPAVARTPRAHVERAQRPGEIVYGFPKCPDCRSSNRRGSAQKIFRAGDGYRCRECGCQFSGVL